MRYVITYMSRSDEGKKVYLLTHAAELADNSDQAVEQFEAKHPDKLALSTERVDDFHEAFERFGEGAWTDEERAEHREKLHKRYEALREENIGIEGRLLTYAPDELERETEYMNRRESEQTQNAEGVHVGDIFHTCWGYDQTNIDFYQVVALKGKHTMVLRGLAEKCELDASWNGKTRPVRDEFRDGYGSGPYTVRTKADDDPSYCNGIRAHIEDRRLYPVEFGKLYDYSSGA